MSSRSPAFTIFVVMVAIAAGLGIQPAAAQTTSTFTGAAQDDGLQSSVLDWDNPGNWDTVN